MQLYCALILSALLIWYSYKSSSEKDYLTAAQHFAEIKRSNFQQLTSLNTLLFLHPDLQAKYDGELAQLLLANNHPQEAAPFIHRLLLRKHPDTVKDYLTFARLNFALSQNKLKEAQEHALSIPPTHPLLHTLTTLELALLAPHPDWQAIQALSQLIEPKR